jgi:hypothetical protein
MWSWLATAPWKGASALSAIYVTWTQEAVNGKPPRLLDQLLGMTHKPVPFDCGVGIQVVHYATAPEWKEPRSSLRRWQQGSWAEHLG